MVTSALLLLAAACSNGDREKPSPALFGRQPDRVATITKTLSVGLRSRGAEYEFESILDLLPMPDGNVWVLSADRSIDGRNSTIRIFDSTGKFVRQVGAYGKGPGEYQVPYGMARLGDGRVAVRDNGFPERVLLYEADGTRHADLITDGRTSWPKLVNFRWLPGRSDAIRADTFGVAWLPFDANTIHTDSGTAFSARYVRVRAGGQFIDIVDSPEISVLPEARVTWKNVSPTGVASVNGFFVPYQPRGDYALSPGAQFAVARTDTYQIDVMDLQLVADPTQHAPVPPPHVIRTIRRDAPVVRVAQAEQDSIVAQWKRDAVRLRVDSLVTLPAPPKTKPAISHFTYADDGQLLVWVSQASTLTNGKWVEPQAIDVFDQGGNYVGRMNFPSDFSLKRMHGSLVWGVSTVDGYEVPERFSIQW